MGEGCVGSCFLLQTRSPFLPPYVICHIITSFPQPMKKTHAALILATLTATTAFTACDADADYIYSSRHAFFRFTPVTATPQTLFPALNSPGAWCSISVDGSYYRFSAPEGGRTDTYPIPAAEQYHPRQWVSGLLAGTPSVPSIITNNFEVVCYDLVCPNCMEADAITRAVRFSFGSRHESVACSRCNRVHNLQNQGEVCAGAVDGEPNRPLLRYRCSYANDVFVVQN